MTRKSGCRRALAVAVLWCCVQLFAVAENIPSSIVSFDDSEVEVRKDGNFDYLSIDDFPALPLKVHEKDSKGFLLVDTKDGGTVWVSPSYVTTDTLRDMKKNCQQQKVAQQRDKRQYGVRGVGEGCE
mgnify:CR=1 FL=1